MKLTAALLAAAILVPGLAADDWQRARENAAGAQRGIRFAKRAVYGWLDQADPDTGLIPRNLRRDRYWNAKDAAADNFPFFLLTAQITGLHHLKRATLEMLETEQRLTNRLDRLPDDFLFDRQGFRDGPYRLDDLIFGASEYAKDGLTPITEWLGPGPWLERMRGLIDDIWKRAPYDSPAGKLPSHSLEVNGELLQVCSRLYWMTGEPRYRDWAFRLADHYLLAEENDILKRERLQLDDHSCEIIGGLSEAYVLAAKTDEERWEQYRPRMHAILDRVLEVGRNRDGLLYHTVNPVTGAVINDDLTDNWGYNYNAFLTVAQVDGTERYRKAVEFALENLYAYRDYPWEGGGADGYADSIEGAINLLNRIPAEGAWRWVERSMQVLLARQRPDGIIEGWHGDGNAIRTTLMWVLWKTQGITAEPWREDVAVGAAPLETGGVRVWVSSRYPWRGRLRFDRPRHRVYHHFPLDYPRLNQFPEWFVVEAGTRYRVIQRPGGQRVVDGRQLYGFELELPENGEAWLTVLPENGGPERTQARSGRRFSAAAPNSSR